METKESLITQTILKGEEYYKGFSIQRISLKDRTIEHEKKSKYCAHRVYRRGIIDKVFPSKIDACNFIDNFIEGITSYHTLITNNKQLLNKLLSDIPQTNN